MTSSRKTNVWGGLRALAETCFARCENAWSSLLSHAVTMFILSAIWGGAASAGGFGDFLDKARDVTGQINRATESADRTLNGTGSSGGSGGIPQIVGASSFQPGNDIIFQSHFDTASPSASLGQWKTNGSSDIVTVNGYPGRWLVLAADSSYKLKKFIHYPRKFTVEFDVLALGGTIDDIERLGFGFERNNVVRKWLYPSRHPTSVDLKYFVNKIKVSGSNGQRSNMDFDFTDTLNRPFHVAIAVDGQRMSAYVAGVKVAGSQFFKPNQQKHFYVSGSGEYQRQAKALVRNVRIAGFKSP